MIKTEIDQKSIREFRRLLGKFEKQTGIAVEEAIIDMAKSTARRLTHTVQPYGTSSKVGEKFTESVEAQIDRAWYGANVGAFDSSSMAAAHKDARNSNGVVPKRRFRTFKNFQIKISVSEKEQYKRQKIKNVGIAKAGWVSAGESTISVFSKTKSGKQKILSGIAKWIRRHVKPALGSSKITRKGISTTVDLTNKVTYIAKLQSESDQNVAINQGRRNGIARIKHILKRLEKTI